MTVKRQRSPLIWLILLSSFAGLGIGIARVGTALWSIELRANELELGLIAAAQSVGILFTSLPIGILIQRHGPLKPLCLGSLLCGLIYLVTTTVPSVWFFVVCTALVSFVMPLRFISLNTVYMQQIEHIGVARSGWFRATHMTGFLLIGPLVGIFLLDHFGFPGTYIAIALTFFFAVASSPLAVDKQRKPPAGHEAPALSWEEVVNQVRLLLASPDLVRASLIEFFSQSISAFFGFFIVIIALQNYHYHESTAAFLLSVQGTIFVIVLFAGGAVVARFGAKRAYQVSLIVLAVALIILSYPLGDVPLWGASALLGMGLGMVYIVNFIEFARIGKTLGMGRVSGISGLIGPTGSFLGSLLGGGLGSVLGLQTIFLPMGIVCISFLWLVRHVGKTNATEVTTEGLKPDPAERITIEEGAT